MAANLPRTSAVLRKAPAVPRPAPPDAKPRISSPNQSQGLNVGALVHSSQTKEGLSKSSGATDGKARTWASTLKRAWGRVTGVGSPRGGRRAAPDSEACRPGLRAPGLRALLHGGGCQVPAALSSAPSGRVTLGDAVQSVRMPQTLPRRPEDSLRPAPGRVSLQLPVTSSLPLGQPQPLRSS